MKQIFAICTLLLCCGVMRADELLVNGGFEDGVYTSTTNGHTNTSVPNGWTPNDAYNLEPGFNHETGTTHSGAGALSIANFDNEPLAELSQSFADVAGGAYTVSFWAFDGGANGDANAFFQILINNVAQITLDETIGSYTHFTFNFTGSGSDTLTIAAQTDPDEWFVDDVSVSGTSVAPVPEPSTFALLGTGILGLTGALRRRRAR